MQERLPALQSLVEAEAEAAVRDASLVEEVVGAGGAAKHAVLKVRAA